MGVETKTIASEGGGSSRSHTPYSAKGLLIVSKCSDRGNVDEQLISEESSLNPGPALWRTVRAHRPEHTRTIVSGLNQDTAVLQYVVSMQPVEPARCPNPQQIR